MKIKNLVISTLLLGYILGIHNDKLALWKDDDPEPIKIFPFSVTSLPKADQNALRHGIKIKDKEGLMHIIEDYLS